MIFIFTPYMHFMNFKLSTLNITKIDIFQFTEMSIFVIRLKIEKVLTFLKIFEPNYD